ncbi:hypothetical protein ER308_03845 [Egibacter rhizosphaerae]|uniref:Uncharacterized protein n=1 Tax=Egibacter rhizosphaerae TaxID=1670831 RepID=A0A411YC91_9ACTN|nr:hypothetical protein [Egibacter rhizosphaerae]QBI18767.1 hypothetical protein ER308_03845 [Egibacter rhizosphaerae]
MRPSRPVTSPGVVLVAALVIALGVTVLAACAEEAGEDDRGEETAAENEQDEDPQAELETELDDAESRIAQLEAELEEAEARITDLEGARDAAEDRAAELEAELQATEDPGDADAEEEAALGEPAPLRSEEGLVDQLRTYFPPPDDLPEGWEPGVGDWREIDVPEGFGEGTGFEAPGQLLTAYAEQQVGAEFGLGGDVWETTLRVLDEDPETGEATGAHLEWGLADDAVVGSDTRLELRDDGDGWYVESAEQRPHCRRGVTDDGTCT